MNRYAIRNSSGKIVKKGFNNRSEAREARGNGEYITKDSDHTSYSIKYESSIHPKHKGKNISKYN